MHRTRLVLAGFLVVIVLGRAPALAEDRDSDEADLAATPDATTNVSPADSDLDWTALNIDALTLMENPAARSPRDKRSSANAPGAAWSTRDNPNGSSAVTVKQLVTPFWDTNVGADLSVARDSNTAFTQTRPEQFRPDISRYWDHTERSTGTAWASMTAPGVGALWDKTAIEARVDPLDDRSKLGTRLTKSLPLANDQVTLTLENGFNLQQHGIIPGLPLGRSARTLEIDRTARLRINDSGLNLIAGQTLSPVDDRWLGKVGAEQSVFGGINVTGSVSQTPDGLLNKSLSAGFKRSW